MFNCLSAGMLWSCWKSWWSPAQKKRRTTFFIVLLSGSTICKIFCDHTVDLFERNCDILPYNLIKIVG